MCTVLLCVCVLVLVRVPFLAYILATGLYLGLASSEIKKIYIYQLQHDACVRSFNGELDFVSLDVD